MHFSKAVGLGSKHLHETELSRKERKLNLGEHIYKAFMVRMQHSHWLQTEAIGKVLTAAKHLVKEVLAGTLNPHYLRILYLQVYLLPKIYLETQSQYS